MLKLIATTHILGIKLTTGLRDRLANDRERGSLTMEQAIIAGILCAGAIVLGGVIIAAIRSHSADIQ